MIRESQEQLSKVFDRQVENLIEKGYPRVARLKVNEFVEQLEPLKARIKKLAALEKNANDERIPFVIVVKNDLVSTEQAMSRIELDGKKGFVAIYPVETKSFQPIEGVIIPNGIAYLMLDIDTGKATLNITPDEALKTIRKEKRFPLTMEEGVALVTHYPNILKTRNYFSMLGSRRGDRRVTALWLSGGRPRLGWCWAGNPHSWLGAASCSSRMGLKSIRNKKISIK